MNSAKRWEILLSPHAERSLKRLKKQRQLLKRIDVAILSLRNNPRPNGCKKLVSRKYDNLYRIRVGEWRILYAIEEDEVIIIILDVVRRNRPYRDL